MPRGLLAHHVRHHAEGATDDQLGEVADRHRVELGDAVRRHRTDAIYHLAALLSELSRTETIAFADLNAKNVRSA